MVGYFNLFAASCNRLWAMFMPLAIPDLQHLVSERDGPVYDVHVELAGVVRNYFELAETRVEGAERGNAEDRL